MHSFLKKLTFQKHIQIYRPFVFSFVSPKETSENECIYIYIYIYIYILHASIS